MIVRRLLFWPKSDESQGLNFVNDLDAVVDISAPLGLPNGASKPYSFNHYLSLLVLWFLFKNIIIATSFALSMQLDNVFFYIMVSDVLTKCASLSNFRKPYIISASCVRFCLRFIKKDLRLGM